ncbi:F0F1 ATP synthase subunit delta [Campylobacter sp. 9BO]|uniref:F0F1 ATP synthase subunit delta n=1 Tax=Campylobacter sp. 9BO TaxID=3424759 RepID=UPI003D341672
MNEITAKKYVKAILNGTDKSELDGFLANLQKISDAFALPKFQSIISIPTLKIASKVDFILSLVENPNVKFKNFIKLLGENKRLELLPTIYKELKAQKAIIENVYLGEIYGDLNLSENDIKALEDKFSKRFNAQIKLESAKDSYKGIKIELKDLGVEVSFSVDRLRAQLSEYILKAI